MLSHIRLRTKLGLLLAVFVVGLIALAGMDAVSLHRRLEADRVDKLRATVEMALSYANALERRVDAKEITREDDMTALRAAMHGMRFDNGEGYVTVEALDGMVLIHGADAGRENKQSTAKDGNGRPIVDLIKEALGDRDSGVITYLFPKPGQKEALPKVSYVSLFRPLNSVFLAGAYVDDLDAAFRAQMVKVGAIGGIVLLVVLAITWLVNRDITGSLGRLKQAMTALAGGDLSVEIPGLQRRDEVGEMAAAVKVFQENAQKMEQLKLGQEQAELHARAEKQQSMATLADEFEASVGALVGSVASAAGDMEQTAASMSSTADETAQQASSVAAASEQASVNVQSVAGAAEELSSSVREIGRQVASSSEIASRAVDQSERTNALVKGLADAAQKIGTVTRMISEIASQTNLLALNATIEAARAGDAGKGFAVVASEVKNLASQTAKATDEISEQIAAMQSATGDTVAAIQTIGQTIGELNDIGAAIAAAVEEQGAVTQEIARSVQEAAAGTQQVSTHIAGVTHAVSTTGSAANQVFGASGELSKKAEALRSQVEGFLAVVRAA